MPSILETKFGKKIEGVIPEFPVRIGTIDPTKKINKSFKIDYLAKIKEENSAIFVELKTDDSSRREKQDWYLNRAQEVGLVSLLDGLEQIYRATNAKGKYKFLLKNLQEMGLLTFTENNKVLVSDNEFSSKIVYLQPNNVDAKENVMSFSEIADIVELEDDGIGKRFAKSLREWANVKAGNV